MDYDLDAEATALETLVVVAANELIESYESVDSGVMPKNQHRLAQAVYALRRFRKRRGLHTDGQETEDQKLDVSQGQYME